MGGGSTISSLVVVNLFLCPFLSNGYKNENNLSYYFCTNGMAAFWSFSIVVFLLTLYVLFQEQLNKKTGIIAGIALIASGYHCICKGLGLLIFLGIPLLVYLILELIILNDYRVLIRWKSLYIYFLIVAMMLGRILGEKVLGLTYIDVEKNWIHAGQFWENVGNIYLAFKTLVGAIPSTGIERSPASFTGMCYFAGEVIFYVILIAFVYSILRSVKNISQKVQVDKNLLLVQSVVVTTVFEYILIDTAHSEDVFETRYLIIALISLFLLVGYFIDSLSEELIFKRVGIIVLTLSIMFMNLFSDYVMAVSDTSEFKIEECFSVIDKTDAKLVYFWADDRELTLTQRVIRIIDPTRVYKLVGKDDNLLSFGDYKYYDNSKEYKGATVLVLSGDGSYFYSDILDEYILINRIDNYSIYYCKDNPIDLQKLTKPE